MENTSLPSRSVFQAEADYVDIVLDLRSELEDQGMSTREASRRIGQSSMTVHRWLAGTHKMSLEGYLKLCDVLGIDPRSLL